MERANMTPEQVAAALAVAKVRMLEAGKARLSALVELSVHKEFVSPAKAMVSATLSELEMILDSAIMLSLPEINLPMLQEARREVYQKRTTKGRPGEVEPEAAGQA